jgi:hypothetical protein
MVSTSVEVRTAMLKRPSDDVKPEEKSLQFTLAASIGFLVDAL